MNLLYCLIVLVSGFIVSAKSDKPNQETDSGNKGFCSLSECVDFRDRLDTLEDIVQKIVTVLSSQTNPVFVPISQMLEKDPTVKLILSRSQQIPGNVTLNSTIEIDTQPPNGKNCNRSRKLNNFVRIQLLCCTDCREH